MPLIKSRSKAAFKKNVATEMREHPDNPKQALAISYSVKRKAPKKKASGGTVSSGSSTMNYADGGEAELNGKKVSIKFEHPSKTKLGPAIKPKESMEEYKKRTGSYAEGGTVSASNEKRPSTDYECYDTDEISANSNKKELYDSQWDSRPDIKQTTKGMKTTKIKHPKMVPQSGYTARLRDEEDDLQSSAGVNEGSQHQPPAHDNEEDPKKRGSNPPKQPLHTANLNEYAEGGMINDFEPMSEAEEDHAEHPAGLESDNDQMRPPKDEYMADHMQMLAEGGIASEEEIEHAASIAAAIMARRKMAAGGSVESGSKDMNMAEGGQVDIDDNNNEEPNEYYHLNEDEVLEHNMNDSMPDGTPEDSAEEGDEREDETSDPHGKSLASKIRAKAKAAKKSPITR